ncbi:alpha/beta fold hydrolase [Cryobacterium arcticum]|uniref:Hydrolase n=1 Tax=Cryobacterium arcticum TaxID=670052 RepID=A0A1B1BPC4_9MICO|nr:alpha/beta hydrolase [Cryobacterium arcticum]ANP74233.1 Hydrolase [Cryobacterium arcticum]
MPATSPLPRIHGIWPGGMPYLAVGSGTPLLFLPGLTPNHEPPTGADRRFQTRMLLPFAATRRVWWVNRRPGLDPDATMADIAADYALAMRQRFDGPVDVMGQSTGGSVALQLAADHPDLVKRLVIVSAAHQLGIEGRDTAMRVADDVLDGRPRTAYAELMRMLGSGAGSQRVLSGIGWLLGKNYFAHATADLMTTIRAEDGFELYSRLGDITAPTLVVGGERDAFYTPELFRQTAAGIPRGRLALYPDRGHLATTSDPRFVSDVLSFLDPPDEPADDPAGTPTAERPHDAPARPGDGGPDQPSASARPRSDHDDLAR